MKKQNSEKTYVVGHVGGIRSCFWEPWDNSLAPVLPLLCKNHIWKTPLGECHILPFHYTDNTGTTDIDISSGIMHFKFTSDPFELSGGHYLLWESKNDMGRPAPIVGKLRIKVTASSSYYCGIFLITATTSKKLVFVFVGSVPPHFILIGDNGGNEMLIDLVALGMPEGEKITSVFLENTPAPYGGSSEMNIDYIAFS